MRKQAQKAAVVGIDLLETEPLEGVAILQMDFMADAAPGLLEAALDGPPDLVIAGCAILEAIRRRWPCDRLRVADRGLREGMLVELMAEDGVWRPRARRPGAAAGA